MEYVHRVVAAQAVSWPHGDGDCPGQPPSRRVVPPVVWGIEPQRSQEGEVDAGVRLLERTRRQHGHFCDVVRVDALSAQGPFS